MTFPSSTLESSATTIFAMASPIAPVIVHDLVKRYGEVEAVRGVSFEVGAGEIFGLLGPNGAGKTSTLECVIGLRVPDGGSIQVCGIDARKYPAEVKRKLGAQLQSTALQDKITPREALRLFGSFYANSASPQSLIDRFSLGEKADAAFDSLSGGQKQRLALALAFVNRPEVVFLDEPTTGLDPQSRRELHKLIQQVRSEGHTVVLTTHYIEEAEQLCDRIAIIDHGKVIASGTPRELIESSKSLPRIVIRATRPLEQSLLGALSAVREMAPVRDGEGWELRTTNVSQTAIELVQLVQRQENELLDLQVRKPSLEDVFIELTGIRLARVIRPSRRVLWTRIRVHGTRRVQSTDMPGLLQHLLITLRLNFRSKQALFLGYVFPVFYLVVFAAIFRDQLGQEFGPVLVISILGGACFGMPTSMVSERERGVWRRYRLLPAATGGLIFSTMVARFLIVASAALLQYLLAIWWYHLHPPAHPGQLLVAFTFVAFAFLGMGLVIAMLADTVPAVQALGQAVFLPMIVIGGVGVPLYVLPHWAKHVADFLPGRYAVAAMQNCIDGKGLESASFDMLALMLIGIAGIAAGQRLFRWEGGQKLPASARGWALLALAPWAAVGIAATVQARAAGPQISNPIVDAVVPKHQPAASTQTSQTQPTTLATGAASTTGPSVAATQPPLPKDWQSVTDAQIDHITYDDLQPDQGDVTPVAPNLDNLNDDAKKRMDDLATALSDWKGTLEPDELQKVRNLLSVAAVADVLQDVNESQIPLIIFDRLKMTVPKDDLIKILAYMSLKPDEGTFPTGMPELKLDVTIPEDQVRERAVAYGQKLLGRLLGKLPVKTVDQ